MAARQTGPVVRIVVTLFTSLVAPTLVALFTTAIREAPRPDSPQTVCSYGSSPSATIAPAPWVTLLPPAPAVTPTAPARVPLVWRPVAVSNGPAAVSRNATPRY